MPTRIFLILFSFLFLSLQLSAQNTLSTSTSNNGSGGVFLQITATSNNIGLTSFNTYFQGVVGTTTNVEVYTRSGSYAGFTTSNSGWTLVGTIPVTQNGSGALSVINVSGLNINIPSSTTMSIYLHSTGTSSGIRYNGTGAVPPVTSYSDANISLMTGIARTGTVPFGGTQFTPRAYAGTISYNLLIVTPVKWLGVWAVEKDRHAQIEWEVVENNVAYYEVERKGSDNTFKSVFSITSKGGGNNRYVYLDAASLIGSNRVEYRIKQVDNDGKFTYSPIVVYKQNSNNVLKVSPNPFTNYIQVESYTAQLLTVYDVIGNAIAIKQLKKGTNLILLENLAAGNYFIKTSDGQSVSIIK
jgi:hypothetical protein